MKTFVKLTVSFAKDQTRSELINTSKIYRIIERGSGCLICFNSSGSDNIEVTESKAELEKILT
ncbi:MAG: hypothetical protein ABJH04_10205 [Cyclobacteriaceae bacterium]